MPDDSTRDRRELIRARDDFEDDRRRGRVIGTASPRGAERIGVDREGSLSIDHGALRIRPLAEPGWQRSAIGFEVGPPEPGVWASAWFLNGHHASQTSVLEVLKPQIRTWLKGSHTTDWWRRAPRLLTTSRRESPVRRIVRWRRMADATVPEIHENFAVGWFTRLVGDEPSKELAVAIRAADESNGALVVAEGGRLRVVAEGVPNVPLFVALGVRTRDVCVFVAAPEHVASIPAYPAMRPVAILDLDDVTRRFFLVEQSVLGEIGFSVDSRVFSMQVVDTEDEVGWFGTAHAADSFVGSGTLHGVDALRGGRWSAPGTGLARSAEGLVAPVVAARASLRPGAPSGLVRARFAGVANAAVHLRALDESDELRCEVRNGVWRLVHRESGVDRELAAGSGERISVLEIVDGEDGRTLRIVVDGVSTPVDTSGRSLPAGTGIGVSALGVGPIGLVDLEAHPLHVHAPAPVELPVPERVVGRRPVLALDFTDDRVGDLQGVRAPTGSWRRDVGTGNFRVEPEHGVVVDATATRPCPGRTIFTVPWPDPAVADLETTIVPPSRSGDAMAMSRAGLVFWDDSRNHLIVSLWLNDRPEHFVGGSVSSFIVMDGHEDVYDAVWTNVSQRIAHGAPVRLRVSFDGDRYLAWLDDELVLWRSISDVYPRAGRFAISRVGLVANWEWGTDTGSVFRRLVGRAR